MANEKSFSEKTSADDKSIGFEYQYYYFLDRLLNMKSGQTVGLEVKDDVHTTLDADINILVQLKHTVRSNAKGDPVALTELDSDLWKTIYNWSQIISDEAEGRKEPSSQLRFVRKTDFHLVSNKSQSKTNEFLQILEGFNSGEFDFHVLLNHVNYLENKTTDRNIKGYIESVLKLEVDVLAEFFRRIGVELELDDIIGRVKRSLLEKIIDPDKVDTVFSRLDSGIRADNFIAVKRGDAILISFDDFMKRYRRIFDDGRTKKLVYPKFIPELPSDIFAQRFIKRLLEIGDISESDEELAIDYTTYKLRISRYLEQWVQEGDLVSEEIEAFHEEVFVRWRNEFRVAFRGCSTSHEIIDAAMNLLIALRRDQFKLGDTELSTTLSNGELYYLSDAGQIGWHKDWSADES
ncbi:ABC-three component system protein [Burkholderia glumae]|uniref:ABC-three component system protein n=1 Tax=Burkholderia glumae TaxID=337 RepID=UPI00214FAAE1|nr:ABC-three component system protein [Burkholderia glumae]